MVLTIFAWALCGYSSFRPHAKDMQLVHLCSLDIRLRINCETTRALSTAYLTQHEQNLQNVLRMPASLELYDYKPDYSVERK